MLTFGTLARVVLQSLESMSQGDRIPKVIKNEVTNDAQEIKHKSVIVVRRSFVNPGCPEPK